MGNRILDLLPARQRSHLLARLEEVSLPIKAVVAEPGEPMEHVLFPLRGVVSEMAVTDGDACVEVAAVGSEGVVGLCVFLDAGRSTTRAVCCVPVTGLRMDTPAFRAAAGVCPELQTLLRRYTAAFVSQVAQNVACHRRHANEARIARWLLTTHDRVAAESVPVTQEYLSDMLGVRRSTVSLSATALQRAGLIRYQRGHITITDRAGLEAAACSCYGAIKAEAGRLLV